MTGPLLVCYSYKFAIQIHTIYYIYRAKTICQTKMSQNLLLPDRKLVWRRNQNLMQDFSNQICRIRCFARRICRIRWFSCRICRIRDFSCRICQSICWRWGGSRRWPCHRWPTAMTRSNVAPTIKSASHAPNILFVLLTADKRQKAIVSMNSLFSTVGIWNRDKSGFWMVVKRMGLQMVRISNGIWNPEAQPF